MTERPGKNARQMDAPVTAVTLFEDRARIKRCGRVTLEAGQLVLRVADVAPVASDTSLFVSVAEDGATETAATVVDSRITRRRLVRPRSEVSELELDELERERDALDRELEQLAAQLLRLEQRREAFGSLAGLVLDEIAEDASWGREDRAEWSRRLETVRSGRAECGQRMADLQHDQREKQKLRERLARRIESLHTPSVREQATIEVELLVERAGEVVLELEYLVPGACWRPYHTARLDETAEAAGNGEGTSPARLRFQTDGCVWQNTGEDWTDVRLHFSTQRPSLGTEPPRLESDTLEVEPKEEGIVVEAREQEVTTTGLEPEARAAAELPGIDDAGEAVSLEARAPASVPSDGRAYRVPLLELESEAEVRLVARPELVPAALTESVQTNTGVHPILAGPVDLVRGGGFVGRTSTLFVAAGERFALGWGPDAELRIERDVEVTKDKDRLLSSWETRRHRTRLRLSNLGPHTKVVEVSERMPVSEIDKVTIEPDPEQTTGGKQPDSNGFVAWRARLGPFRHDRIELRYTLKKHPDVRGI